MLDYSLEKVLRTTKAHILKLQKIGIFTVRDMLEFFPRKLESAETRSGVSEISLGEKQTLYGTLNYFRKEKTRGGKPLGKADLELSDGTSVEVVWFRIPYQLRNFEGAKKVFLVGKVERRYGTLQISNPEIHFHQNVHVGGIRPVYSESPPLTSKWFREKISGLMVFAKEFGEALPEKVLKSEDFLGKQTAIKAIHFPDSPEMWQRAKSRLGFEEILGIQLRVMQSKFLREKIRQNSYKFGFDPEAIKKDFELFPFELTVAQKKALLDILQDFEKDRPMNRLVQGDVGAGKTIVAFLAALQVVKQGYQAAILAPTEILAKQHFAGALKFFPAQYSVEILTGSTTAKKKEQIKARLKSGELKIVIGTHAILTEDTIFKNLALAVIDEQHRFGVKQRNLLGANHSHVLNMTATPIPRSLALTIYGDQDLSIIGEKPAGRKEIITRVVADQKTLQTCNHFIDDQIVKGRQVFWVCPLVEESEKLEAKNVMEEYVRISEKLFPQHRVAFLHGKMKPKEKDEIMRGFKEHLYDILVSTSVIEVGVDIPKATVMVIENSERFGLSQLHQFRGRIGRNDMQSYCFLMVGDSEDKHKERLKAMEKSNDGFYLSEVDLKLRGAGEVYGIRQSGIPDLKLADLHDVETLKKARDWAEKLLEDDLTLEKHPGLKKLVQKGEVYYQ